MLGKPALQFKTKDGGRICNPSVNLLRDEVDVKAHLAEKKRNQKKRPNPGAEEGGEMGDGAGRRAKKTAQNKVGQTTDVEANPEKI